jgi:hypothetical protein
MTDLLKLILGIFTDRFLFVWLYRWFPSILEALAIVRPETIICWYRSGFRAYWRWRSCNRVGRPKISVDLRRLIGEMSWAVDLAPDYRGIPMGPCAAISHSGSGQLVGASDPPFSSDIFSFSPDGAVSAGPMFAPFGSPIARSLAS